MRHHLTIPHWSSFFCCKMPYIPDHHLLMDMVRMPILFHTLSISKASCISYIEIQILYKNILYFLPTPKWMYIPHFVNHCSELIILLLLTGFLFIAVPDSWLQLFLLCDSQPASLGLDSWDFLWSHMMKWSFRCSQALYSFTEIFQFSLRAG